MIFLFLLPGYLLACLYVAVRGFQWLGSLSKKFRRPAFIVPTSAVLALFVYSPMLAMLLPKSIPAILVRRLSSYWMGIILYTIMSIVFIEILRFVCIHTKLRNTKLFTRSGAIITGLVVIAAAALCCIVGSIHARKIKTTTYNVTINKQVEGMDEMKIVLIADTHLGYAIGRDHIKKTVDMINACKPDLVIFAGDIFDNSLDGLDYPDELAELFASIDSKYGTWAVYGNHDINEKILMGFTFSTDAHPTHDDEMAAFLEKANINILTDESILIDDKFYLVGRRDAAKPGSSDGRRLSAYNLTRLLDKDKPIFFIAHEPDELRETADAGADIDFSGHTHDGQTFPLTVITRRIWENCCGVLKKDDMYSIVTSGVGVFGPFMRLGTDAEICEINVRFSDA